MRKEVGQEVEEAEAAASSKSFLRELVQWMRITIREIGLLQQLIDRIIVIGYNYNIEAKKH